MTYRQQKQTAIRVYLNKFLFLDTNVSFNFQLFVNKICSFEIFSTWRGDSGCWRSMGSPHESILTLAETDDCLIVSHIVLVRHQWNPPSHHSNEWLLSGEPFWRPGQRTDPSLRCCFSFCLLTVWTENWGMPHWLGLNTLTLICLSLILVKTLVKMCGTDCSHKLIVTFAHYACVISYHQNIPERSR